MKINLSPQRRDETITVEKNGDRLRINGDLFNFNVVPEGATIKAEDIPSGWVCGDVSRIDGVLHLCLILPHGADPAEYVAFPKPIDNPPDGVLDLPFSPYSESADEEVEGGRNITVTRYEWRAQPVVTTEFVPDPPPEEVNGSFEVWRKAVVMEDEGIESFIDAFPTRAAADEWISQQEGRYFKPFDYYVKEPANVDA